jgi:hypothetical protein
MHSAIAASASSSVAHTIAPLPAREPVGLHHERGAHLAAEATRTANVVEGREPRGRDPVAPHQVLGERLGTFDRRRARARPEDGQPRRGEPIGEAGDERRLWTDHRQIDALAPGERDELVVRVDADVDAARVARDARIAGCREQRVDQRALRDLPGQRVLPARRARPIRTLRDIVSEGPRGRLGPRVD